MRNPTACGLVKQRTADDLRRIGRKVDNLDKDARYKLLHKAFCKAQPKKTHQTPLETPA